MLSATDKMQKLYGSTLSPVVWARSVGLDVLNEWTGAKRRVMLAAGAGSTGGDGLAAWWDLGASAVSSAAGAMEGVRKIWNGTGR